MRSGCPYRGHSSLGLEHRCVSSSWEQEGATRVALPGESGARGAPPRRQHPSLCLQKVKAYTTPTTTMFPRVAMMAIHSRTASLEERGDSSGWLWPLELAWTLAGKLNREYSVLKSSLDESMNAPPIMGNCKEKRQNEPGCPAETTHS